MREPHHIRTRTFNRCSIAWTETVKDGPMRGFRVHHPVHGHLHGLTRHSVDEAELFVGFAGKRNGNNTFTDPPEALIKKERDIQRNPRITGGDDNMIGKKDHMKTYGTNANNISTMEKERKLNIVMKAYGEIDRYVLVRGVSLRKEALGKLPGLSSYSPEGSYVA